MRNRSSETEGTAASPRRLSSMVRGLVSASLFSLVMLVLPDASAQRAEPRDAPPQLIEMGPKWRNVDELKRHAAAGDAGAAFELAERHVEGDGVPRDYAAAREWFGRAADAGVPDAWFRLGKLHHDGLGVPEDRAKAFELFARAAKHGVPEAQHNVGAMLVSGRGVKRDYVEGLAWLIVARQFGADSPAEAQVRERLARRPQDIARAETRARELLTSLGKSEGTASPRAKVESSPAANPPAPPFVPPREAPPKVEVGIPPIVPPPPPVDVPRPKS